MFLKDQRKERKRVDIMIIISVLLLAIFLMTCFFSQSVLLISAFGGLAFVFIFAALTYSYKTYQDRWEAKPKER